MASDSAPLMAVSGVCGDEAKRRDGVRRDWGLEEEVDWKHLAKDEALLVLREEIGRWEEMGLGRELLGSLKQGIGDERESTSMAV